MRTSGRAAEGVEAPACCGPRIAEIIIYLYVEQFLCPPPPRVGARGCSQADRDGKMMSGTVTSCSLG